MEASVDGILVLGKVRSVRPTARDWDAKSSAVKLVSARRPIRMERPEPLPPKPLPLLDDPSDCPLPCGLYESIEVPAKGAA